MVLIDHDRRGDRAVMAGSVNAKILVTGGSGFIGAALVTELVRVGAKVRVLDDNSRGASRRLAALGDDVEFVAGDIRDAAVVAAATRGMDEVHHLAFVNGTEFSYSAPDLVLDVGVKGIVNVIDACRQNNIRNLVLASSAEVYQTASRVPTDESVPLIVPDPHNPRYSYGGGKIISELMAINYGRKYFDRVLIFRPHNIYGPDMGFEHVIPQLTLRLKKEARQQGNGVVKFQMQGSGRETRSFCHISDLVQGVMIMRSRGEHLGIYHIGTSEEVAIGDLAHRIAGTMSLEIELISTSTLAGSTPRRCPDISKLVGLGYQPRVQLNEGLPPTVCWYCENEQLAGQLQARI
jgi:nucleoside-diphosphate-sugar epimerase